MISTILTPKSLPFRVPLCYDTVYYVESPDNEPLNQAMRQLAAAGQPLFEDTEMQPFPFKLMCLSQEELAVDRLSANLAGKFEPELVADTIDNLRECLQADKGGTLTARCLPKFSGEVRLDDRAVCISEDFRTIGPEDAEENAQIFARLVANENFRRLAGVSYSRFREAKEEEERPRYLNEMEEETYSPSSYSSSDMTLRFMEAPVDPREVVRELQENLAIISDSITENTNANDIFEGMEKKMERLKHEGKLASMRKLEVDGTNIKFVLSEEEKAKVVFGRGSVAKTLYIFFLRLIQRAAKEHSDPIYVSKPGLEAYKDELLDLYIRISDKYKTTLNDIASWWDPSSNDFATALSSIRKFFKQELNVEAIKDKYKKCYSIEVMGRDKFNSDVYGIQLDPSDFDLGKFNYR